MIWLLQDNGATAIQKMFSTKYCVLAPSRQKIIFWFQNYRDRGTHSHVGK